DKVLKVMNNLLSNAFKFTDVGGVVGIAIGTDHIADRKHVRITVSDTGCGIAEAELPGIFNRFQQADNQVSDSTGSGIGLYLVHEYVTLHEGRVEVSSGVGKGTSFAVFLPTDLSVEPIHSPASEDGPA